MPEIQRVPDEMMAAARELMREAKVFAKENVHPDHRDGGEDEEKAASLEATHNAMVATVNVAINDHGLERHETLMAVGALVGTLLLQADDEEAALGYILQQAAAFTVQFGHQRGGVH